MQGTTKWRAGFRLSILLIGMLLSFSLAAPPGARATAGAGPPEMLRPRVTAATLRSYPGSALNPPGPIDDSSATTTFTVAEGDFPSEAIVSEVALDVTFSKVGDGTCPGPGGGGDWADEIRFRLSAPDGTRVSLVRFHDYAPSNPDVGQVTVTFDDDAAQSVAGLPIQNGTFRPSLGAMADFDGLDPAASGGVWTLELSDRWLEDPLCFASATLHIETVIFPDLSVEVADAPDPVVAGEDLSYAVTVRNVGAGTATGVVLTDTLPAQVAYIDDTGECSLSAGSGPSGADQLVCAVDDLAPGVARAVQILARVPADLVVAEADGRTTLYNAAAVTAELPDANPAGNAITEATFVREAADLRVVKLSRPDTVVRAGEAFTYTVFVDNLGPSAARGVVFTDTILSGGAFELLSITDDTGRADACVPATTPAGTIIRCALSAPLEPQGSPPGGGRWTVGVTLRANEAQAVDNLVDVVSLTPDPDLDNNQVQAFVSVTAVADLAVSGASVGRTQVLGQPGGTFITTVGAVTAGGGLTYTLVISNHGPSTAENVALENWLPASVEDATAAPGQGSCLLGAPGEPGVPQVCHLGPLGPGRAVTVTVGVTVPASVPSGTLLRQEALVSSDTFDPDNVDDLNTAQTSVSAWADLALGQEQHPATVLPGQAITYVVSVRNHGPSDALGTIVSDTLPEGILGMVWTCGADSGASCVAEAAGDLHTLVDLPAGGRVVYTGTGMLSAQHSITNVAAATPAAGVRDPYVANDQVRVSNGLQTAYLPLLLRGEQSVAAPDLVVEALHATASDVRLVVRNQGRVAVVDTFWVDVYVDPALAPRAVNQTWDALADQGLVWGVTNAALPLAPGETLTLTVGDDYYWEALSAISWPLPSGVPVYAQVDSYNPGSNYGAVLEAHEMLDGAYNNVHGPVLLGVRSLRVEKQRPRE